MSTYFDDEGQREEREIEEELIIFSFLFGFDRIERRGFASSAISR